MIQHGAKRLATHPRRLIRVVCREAYLQECQDYCIDLHHKHRATEISPYAQAQALAGIMEAIETEVTAP